MRLGLWALLYCMVAAQVDSVMAMERPSESDQSEDQSAGLKRKRANYEEEEVQQQFSLGNPEDNEDIEDIDPSQTRRLNVEEEGRGRAARKGPCIQKRRYRQHMFVEDDESSERQKLPFHLRVKTCDAVHEYLKRKGAILIVTYDKYDQHSSLTYIPLSLVDEDFQSFFPSFADRIFVDERINGSLECRNMVYDLSPELYKYLYGVIPESLRNRKNNGPYIRSGGSIKATEVSEEFDFIEQLLQGSALLANTHVHPGVYQLSNVIDDQRDGLMDLGVHGRNLVPYEDPGLLGNLGTSGFLMIPYYITSWFSSDKNNQGREC